MNVRRIKAIQDSKGDESYNQFTVRSLEIFECVLLSSQIQTMDEGT